jgi:uncharacterized protein (TIGR02246 family)
MRVRFLIGICASIVIVGCAHTSAAPPTPDVDLSNPDVAAIVQNARDYEQAFAAGDAKAISAMYAPDVVYLSQGRDDRIGDSLAMKGRITFFSTYNATIAIHVQEVKIMGDMGYDRAKFTMTMTPKAGGATESHVGRVFEIVKKEGGKWLSYRVITNDPQS